MSIKNTPVKVELKVILEQPEKWVMGISIKKIFLKNITPKG